MSHRNALMEWLDQVKKLAKANDYVCLNTIDSIFDVLWYVDKKVLEKHKALIDDICARYHKPNPLSYVNEGRVKVEEFYKEKNGKTVQSKLAKKLRAQFKNNPPKACFGMKDWRVCELSKFGIDMLSKYIDSSLNRCEMIQKDGLWQWFEVIDFIFERPELINPKLIDEYTEDRINFVCRIHRKDNPLTDGIRNRLGKFWRDEKGVWHKERRQRF